MLRGLGPGPATALSFDSLDTLGDRGYAEPEAFSRDADWMSNVVLIAKSTYVWLYQLSRQYGRQIRTLNDIPDEELDRLTRWGFTGLWLIGIWERSTASQRIKQIMGNPEAASSAYSLYDYNIAEDLGGPAAFESLKQRAWRRGIRLASDMVPNHTGIYSKWVVEHPDWFIQESYPPFPGYNFTGVDLSQDSRTVIQIEDGYWDRRDAAVVFKRYDKFTGQTRYIYHGNDGTSMPWNDTAQLNFMMAEVREAVIQTILHVARLTPIIRFDAAMTLAKRHYQRLWYPKPGDGGAIPSRAERGLTKAEFDACFPHEFWREVVDRVAAEVPNTLLLAEAFWLMEGYFVRTLGMHRVYNSAFMNMLKMEDNAKYRQTIKNVLEFSPQILKRFVNFMSNPDEATAVEQFGKGDKYYGIAVLRVPLPGLPRFGHGQIEGFAEKYGMEYRRSYWDETIDDGMVRHHEQAIFPLMRRRHLFSGADSFALFDFVSDQGWVDENVMAYANRSGHERAIIIYNNAYNRTSGRISMSTAINIGSVDAKQLVRRSLGEALGLRGDDGVYYAYRDYRTGLEFLRRGRRLCDEGLHVTLDGYQYHALLDFREVLDNDGLWSRLAERIGDNGVPDLALAYDELRLEPVLRPLYRLTELSARFVLDSNPPTPADIARVAAVPSAAAHAEVSMTGRNKAVTLAQIRDTVDRVRDRLPGQDLRVLTSALALWVAFYAPTKAAPPADIRSVGAALEALGERLVHTTITHALSAAGLSRDQAESAARLVTVLGRFHSSLMLPAAEFRSAFRSAIDNRDLRVFLAVNEYEGRWWLNKERLELFVSAVRCASQAVDSLTKSKKSPLRVIPAACDALLDEAGDRGYRLEPILAWLESPPDETP
jgi:glycosidase